MKLNHKTLTASYRNFHNIVPSIPNETMGCETFMYHLLSEDKDGLWYEKPRSVPGALL